MAKKKNTPARPKQTNLEQADQFLTNAFQDLDDYIDVEERDLYTRIHAVHDQLLLTMKRAGSGQRIYHQDFSTGDPRPSIADTYCHYMAPREADGDTLGNLYALAALKLVEDLAAENRLEDLQRTVDLMQICFLDLVQQQQALQRIAMRYVFSSQYLSKEGMCVLWMALVLDAPAPFFQRIAKTRSLEFPDGHTFDTDEDLEDFTAWAGMNEDAEDESGEEEDVDLDTALSTLPVSAADRRFIQKSLEQIEREDVGFHLRLLPPRFRGLACDHLLEKIETLERANANKYFAEEVQHPYARVRPGQELLHQYQLVIKQLVSKRSAPPIHGAVAGQLLRPPRVNLILLRLCRTFVHLSLAQLLSEEQLAHLRETALERLAEHYRRILNFLQDNHLYQEGNALGDTAESPIVSAYWRRKDIAAQLTGRSEPLSNPHTELPLFNEVETRTLTAVTRRMRRGIEDFLGALTQRDTLELAAGLWSLGQKDTLWLDTCLASSLITAVLRYSPIRKGCIQLRDKASADRGRKAFLERIQPLMDAVYHPNDAYAARDAAAALSFNDLLHCVGHHFI